MLTSLLVLHRDCQQPTNWMAEIKTIAYSTYLNLCTETPKRQVQVS